jgi:hypothetical protein
MRAQPPDFSAILDPPFNFVYSKETSCLSRVVDQPLVPHLDGAVAEKENGILPRRVQPKVPRRIPILLQKLNQRRGAGPVGFLEQRASRFPNK